MTSHGHIDMMQRCLYSLAALDEKEEIFFMVSPALHTTQLALTHAQQLSWR